MFLEEKSEDCLETVFDVIIDPYIPYGFRARNKENEYNVRQLSNNDLNKVRDSLLSALSYLFDEYVDRGLVEDILYE